MVVSLTKSIFHKYFEGLISQIQKVAASKSKTMEHSQTFKSVTTNPPKGGTLWTKRSEVPQKGHIMVYGRYAIY
eukprot:snap_masked-scaffold_6-processed-gene-13.26-mRNA-1 protein AED:1.00 eAED:1.00 QI:0/-1/0/0/-1/1/1/0/73